MFLTGVVITKNSDQTIKKCLDSLFQVVDEIIVNVIKPNEETQTPTIEIVKPELTKKQINYDKINSIFQISNPKVILQQQPKQETGNLKLNSEK